MSIATEIERIKAAKESIINTLKANDIEIEETATIDQVDVTMKEVPILDTTDATATVSDMLLNKTAYVNGEKITGTMEEYNSSTEVFIKDVYGTTLQTSKKYCKENIIVKPEEKTLNVTPTTKVQNFEGLYTNITVNAASETPTSEIPVKDGLLLYLEKGETTLNSANGIAWRDQVNSKNVVVNSGTVFADYNLYFNGSGTQFDTGIPQSELVNGYTIIMRIKPHSWNNYRGLFGLHGLFNGKDIGMVGFQYVDGTISCGNTDTSIEQRGTVTTPEMIPIKTWSTVASVYNGENTGIMYINGEEVDRSDMFGRLTPANNLIIGRGHTANDRYFNGYTSHCIVYNRALSEEEILQVNNYINNNGIDYVTDGLTSYYKLEDGFADEYGTDNLTNNGLTFETSSELNRNVCKAGEGYATFTNNMDKQNITLSILAKSNGNTAEHNFMFAFGGDEATPNNALSLKVSNGKLAIDVSFGAYSTNFNVNDGLWHRYTVTLSEGKYIKVYVDGNLVLEQTHALNVGPKGLLGAWQSADRFYFNGWLADALIYNRALSAEEIIEMTNYIG